MKNEVNDTNVTNVTPETNNVVPENNFNNIGNEAPVMPEMPVQNVAPNMMNATVNTPPASVTPVAGATAGLKAGITIGGVHLSLPALIAMAAAVVLIVGGVVVKVATSTPKAVFKGVVNNAYKEVNNFIKEYEKLDKKFSFSDGNIYANADLTLDTNAGDFAELEAEGIYIKDYKFSGEFGVNAKDQKVLVGAGVEGNGVELNGKLYVEDNKLYLSTSIYDDVILMEGEDVDIDFSELSYLFEQYSEVEEKIETKDLKYVTKAVRNAVNKSFVDDAFEKDSDKIKVDGKSIKVTKYSYEIDDKVLGDMLEVICEELVNDDEFIKIMADATDISKSDLKDGLEELADAAKEIEFEDEIVISLYTKGMFNSYAGLSIEYMGMEIVEICTDGKNVEMTMGVEGSEIVIVAKEEKKVIEMEVEYNDTKIAEFKIRSLTEELVDLDYDITMDDESISGKIYLSKKENKDSITGDYKFELEYEDEYVKASGSYSLVSKDSLGVNTDDSVEYEDVDPEDIYSGLLDAVSEDENLSEIAEEAVEEAREEMIKEKLNQYDMLEISAKEAEDLFKNEKATVLYVGTYDNASKALWNSLYYYEYYYEFYSYYVNTDNESVADLIKAAGDVEYSCTITTTPETPVEGTPVEGTETETTPSTETTETCTEVPVIYFIKDGKVVKALRANATKSDVYNALYSMDLV